MKYPHMLIFMHANILSDRYRHHPYHLLYALQYNYYHKKYIEKFKYKIIYYGIMKSQKVVKKPDAFLTLERQEALLIYILKKCFAPEVLI